MRSIALHLVAFLAFAVPAPAATPLGGEILAFEAALTAAAAPGWAAQREPWARRVADSDSPAILAAAVVALEQSMAWEAVEPAWKTRRSAWASEAGRVTTLAAAARILLELESNTRWTAVREAWKRDRDGWVRRVSALAAPASAPPTAVPATRGAASASAEMLDFLGAFNGDYKAVKAALQKHGASGLDAKDMGIMNLAEPRVTSSTQKGNQQCYTFEARAGITVRTFGVCWVGGKIVAVEDKGTR